MTPRRDRIGMLGVLSVSGGMWGGEGVGMGVGIIEGEGKDDVSVERGGGEKRKLESREEPIQSSHYPPRFILRS